MTLIISNQQARHLVLHLQGLTLPVHIKQQPEQLYHLICRLGFVQVDSIQWVERAHHMILYARNQTYRPGHLKQMIEKERLLFEGWTHDASIVPCKFYPYWRHRFERQEERLREKFINWQGDGFLTHCDDLANLIEKTGPIRSRDLNRGESKKPQQMWQWHDGKAALEFLWRTGRLAIAGRDGFQKIYDLADRAMPQKVLQLRCSHGDFVDWACRSALRRLGFGSPADIARFWDHLTINEVKNWLVENGSKVAVPIIVETADGSRPREVLACPDIEDQLASLAKLPQRLRALSPFDPVIRDRTRLQWLFDFDYRIEIYVPEEKRKYGYYIFPLLERDQLVGRIDMRANRQKDALEVKKLWLEKGHRLSAARHTRLQSELVRQARLAGVARVEWLEGSAPN